LVAGPRPDAPTNPVRPLSGASEYVANVMLGFDSRDSKHTASLIYNVFGERLYVAGRNGAPDGFEQPFHSLDLTYSWYPTDTMTIKLKAQNLLDETATIERQGVTVFEQDPGINYSLSFSWAP
jgi:outer membrane receptor protein involved in Fe transport